MSGKQRREEIKRKRLERAQRLQERLRAPSHARAWPDAGIEPADRERLARHNNTYGVLPEYYADRPFVCRDCGEEHVWTAKQQKWWYEVALGHIDSTAVRCISCRRKRRAASDAHPGGRLVSELCARARALGDVPPDAAAWDEIEQALSSKWWGVRVTAIATLGRWGDARSVARLKEIIETGLVSDRWGDWAHEALKAATKALAECLPDAETPWALDVWLGFRYAGELIRPLGRLPASFWDPVVTREWRRNDPDRLQRLPWVLSRCPASKACQQQWRTLFMGHPLSRVRQAAEWAWRGTA